MRATVGQTAELAIASNRRRKLQDVRLSDFWNRMLKPVGCWLYDGARDINGYGYVKNPLADSPKFITAHRLAWILKNGPIPDGLLVLHKCDVRACCNPEHMFLGTDKDNSEDMYAKQRDASSGEKNIHAKLTIEDVRTIRKEFRRTGPKQSNTRELAKRYGVRPGTIRAIVVGEAWGRIE